MEYLTIPVVLTGLASLSSASIISFNTLLLAAPIENQAICMQFKVSTSIRASYLLRTGRRGLKEDQFYLQGDGPGIYAWQRINQLFNWLPLAALIENKIICMHGGIGRSIEKVEQIEALQRPLTMDAGTDRERVVLMDLLWSDPTENDSVEGLRPNARGPGLVTFGVSCRTCCKV